MDEQNSQPASEPQKTVLNVSTQPAQVAPEQKATAPVQPYGIDESWKNSLPDELKNDPTVKNTKSVADAIKQMVHAQKLVGSDKIPVPNEHTTEEEWSKIYRKLGVPEDAAKYQEMVKLPEGLEKDSPLLKTVLDASHKAGIRPSQSQKIIEAYQNAIGEQIKVHEQRQKAQFEEQVNGLRQEWGQAFDKKIESAKNGLRCVLGQEADNVINDPNLGNNPTFIRIMEKIGELVSEDKLKGDYAGDIGLRSPGEARKEINKIFSDKSGAYFDNKHIDHKRMVDEVNKLYSMIYKENEE